MRNVPVYTMVECESLGKAGAGTHEITRKSALATHSHKLIARLFFKLVQTSSLVPKKERRGPVPRV